MIKTAIENAQNLIVEGAYIPFSWKRDFEEAYLKDIKYVCLIMSETYINRHFDQIKTYANAIETRLDDSWYTKESVLAENRYHLEMCRKYGCDYLWIDGGYCVDMEL